MGNTQEENTRVARALRNRQLECNDLAWKHKQAERPEESQRMRDEAAACMQLAARYEVAAYKQKESNG